MGECLGWGGVPMSLRLDFLRLSHRGLFRGFRDIGRRPCDLAPFPGIVLLTQHGSFSDLAGSVIWISWMSKLHNLTRSDDGVGTRSQDLPLRGGPHSIRLRQDGWVRRLGFHPLHTSTVVICVISSTPAVLKLLL